MAKVFVVDTAVAATEVFENVKANLLKNQDARVFIDTKVVSLKAINALQEKFEELCQRSTLVVGPRQSELHVRM